MVDTAKEQASERPDDPGTEPAATIGVIGGSGFYSWWSDARQVEVTTPFGAPSEPPVIAEIAGRQVAFIPRHGRDHRFLPHRVNYRANIWALRSLGVRQILGPSAVGSLHHDLGPGSLVVPDQVIDRTWGRAHTVYDQEGPAVHLPFADPYCPRGRNIVVKAAHDMGWHPREQGTLAVINGPRFSTRAESRWHAAAGADIVGMTNMPESAIARELAVCYTGICLVTDLDAGFEEGEAVTQTEVFRVFGESVERLKALLVSVIEQLPADDECSCRHALDGLTLPFDLP
jgi:5'-methylthioadenosine phosphorylase